MLLLPTTGKVFFFSLSLSLSLSLRCAYKQTICPTSLRGRATPENWTHVTSPLLIRRPKHRASEPFTQTEWHTYAKAADVEKSLLLNRRQVTHPPMRSTVQDMSRPGLTVTLTLSQS